MKIKVWVGSLAEYNNGKLVGKWFELPVNSVEKEILNKFKPGEELAIMDYEAEFPIDQYEDLEKLNKLADHLQIYENLEEVYWTIEKDKIGLAELLEFNEENLGYLLGDDTMMMIEKIQGGNVNFSDDYIYLDDNWHLQSMNKHQFQRMLENNAKEIIDEFAREFL